MKILFLPGNSEHNKEWVNQLANDTHTKLEKNTYYYNHWETGEETIDFDTELLNLKITLSKDKYLIVAKSAGCALSLMAFKQGITDIYKFIFIGYPYTWLEMLKIDPIDLLKDISKEILFIQKPLDPAIPFLKLKESIGEVNDSFSFLEYERVGESIDNHRYEDTKYLGEIVSRSLN